jgi:tetratricopeptide (TPR) repeat protein
MFSEAPLYLFVAPIYGALGLVVTAVFGCCRGLRREPTFHLATLAVTAGATVVAVATASAEFQYLANVHVGTQFFLFLTAGLFYVPPLVFMGLHYWSVILEKLLSPGNHEKAPPTTETRRQQITKVRDYLRRLSQDPTNAALRERLGNVYLRMGYLDSAVYEYRKTAEWLDRGYGHSKILYKMSYVLAHKKGDVAKAVPILRRLERLYPRSYFASYARRILNRYDAERAARKSKRAEELTGPSDSEPNGSGL